MSFSNEPILELRRAPERDALLEALRALDARLPLKVPVLIGGDRGAAAGLEFRFDRQRRTPNTVDAHRLIRHAGEIGGASQQDAVVEGLFRAYFQDGRDIGDAAVLAEVASETGMEDAAAFLASGDGAAEVRAEDAGFRRLGISGVPSFALAGHILFSGAVPAERMADAFRRALAILHQNFQAL